jgi:hypothetical protein
MGTRKITLHPARNSHCGLVRYDTVSESHVRTGDNESNVRRNRGVFLFFRRLKMNRFRSYFPIVTGQRS